LSSPSSCGKKAVLIWGWTTSTKGTILSMLWRWIGTHGSNTNRHPCPPCPGDSRTGKGAELNHPHRACPPMHPWINRTMYPYVRRKRALISMDGWLRAYTTGAFGRALRADSLLNPARALPNSFSEKSDSLLILWSDSPS
jgi:hypothetical protein